MGGGNPCDFGMTRRGFARAGLALPVLPLLARAAGAAGRLAALGRAAGIEVGAALPDAPAPALARLIARECALVTPENALKPGMILSRAGRYQWAAGDAAYQFARRHALGLHGHTIYWYRHPLPGLQTIPRGAGLEAFLTLYGDYMGRVMARYPGVRSWDVLNEITGSRGLLRASAPLTDHGLDFAEALLHRARALAPGARLVINETDLECGDHDCAVRRSHALKILTELRRRGAPLDAFGIQSHLGTHRPPDPEAVLAFIRRIEALGMEVYISELDVNDAGLRGSAAERDAEVARIYRDYLDMVLKSPAVRRILFWGLADSASWMVAGGGRQRQDGAALRPALFDSGLQPKPAYFQVLEALDAAPAR